MKHLILSTLLIAGLSLHAYAEKPRKAKSSGRTSTVTGPKGKTATSTVNGQASDGAYSRTRSTTGPQGNTSTVEGQGTYGDGKAQGTRTRTGPKGKSRTTRYEASKN